MISKFYELPTTSDYVVSKRKKKGNTVRVRRTKHIACRRRRALRIAFCRTLAEIWSFLTHDPRQTSVRPVLTSPTTLEHRTSAVRVLVNSCTVCIGISLSHLIIFFGMPKRTVWYSTPEHQQSLFLVVRKPFSTFLDYYDHDHQRTTTSLSLRTSYY
jgi:hypothetical protein